MTEPLTDQELDRLELWCAERREKGPSRPVVHAIDFLRAEVQRLTEEQERYDRWVHALIDERDELRRAQQTSGKREVKDVLVVHGDLDPEDARALVEQTSALVVMLPPGTELSSLDEAEMREAGWVRADAPPTPCPCDDCLAHACEPRYPAVGT